jgi:hypothetical protein
MEQMMNAEQQQQQEQEKQHQSTLSDAALLDSDEGIIREVRS